MGNIFVLSLCLTSSHQYLLVWGACVSAGSLIFAVASQRTPLDHLSLVASRVCICRSCKTIVKRETVLKQLFLQKYSTEIVDQNVSLVLLWKSMAWGASYNLSYRPGKLAGAIFVLSLWPTQVISVFEKRGWIHVWCPGFCVCCSEDTSVDRPALLVQRDLCLWLQQGECRRSRQKCQSLSLPLKYITCIL